MRRPTRLKPTRRERPVSPRELDLDRRPHREEAHIQCQDEEVLQTRIRCRFVQSSAAWLPPVLGACWDGAARRPRAAAWLGKIQLGQAALASI
jgi:hypothetical protein